MPQPKRSAETGSPRGRQTPKPSKASAPRSRSGQPVDEQAAKHEVAKHRRRADRYKDDPDAANALLDEALRKGAQEQGPLREVWDSLQTLIRMVRAYFAGSYRAVPWETVALAIVAVAYFVLPFDLIPDFIPIAGFVDDAAVIAFVIRSIQDDLDCFCEWEAEQATVARSKQKRLPRASQRKTRARRN